MRGIALRSALSLAVGVATCAGVGAQGPDLLPWPKQITWLEGRVALAGQAKTARACFLRMRRNSPAIRLGIAQANEEIRAVGGARLPVVRGCAEARKFSACVVVGTFGDLSQVLRLPGSEHAGPAEMRVPDGYVLRCVSDGDRDIVVCIGHDERGCYYGLQTLTQLLSADEDGLWLPRVEIVDWPSYRIRLVKNSGSRNDPAMIEQFAGLLPRYKINVYALQYHAEEGGTWREPSKRYRDVIGTVGKIAARHGVLEPALFVCPFFEPRIDLTKDSDIALYIDRLWWGIRRGFHWIEVDFNDWAKWQYATEAEKARFRDMGEYMAHLTNAAYEAIRPEFPDVGIIVCPTSPWYRGQARPELVTLCESIPEDVLVYWTGPVTRSRRISAQQVEDWTRATGRKPLLWDNTIYAHFQPYWVGYALNPFFNSFPPNLPELLAGPGIHLNCTPVPHYVPGILTYADYLWNPEGYDPKRSIRTAVRLCWGEGAPDAAQEVQERLVGLYKMLYEAGQGWEPYDRGIADTMLAQLAESVGRIADIADDPALAADIEGLVDGARTAIEEFKPPEKLLPRPEPIPRPLSEGVVNPSVEPRSDAPNARGSHVDQHGPRSRERAGREGWPRRVRCRALHILPRQLLSQGQCAGCSGGLSGLV